MSSFDFGQANDAQKEAILATDGPVLMIAGPGTGKTFTLVKRLAYLVINKGVKPSEIMVVTFTEKAGKELLSRISNEFIKYNLNLNINEMYIGTFHSVCLRLLKENSEYTEIDNKYRMLDAFEQTYLVCRNIENFNQLGGYSRHISGRSIWKQSLEICRYVNQMMEELVDVDSMEADADEDMRFLARLVKRYHKLLERNGAMDFSSIQTKTYDMLMYHPEVLDKVRKSIRYIMVDEYQDTNYIQEQLVFLMAGNQKNICVVGDDDQGMYRFRGATIRNILEFPSRFSLGECRVIHLNTNYRSEPGIIDFYNRWMENVDGINLFHWDKYRYAKEIQAGRQPLLKETSVYSCGGDSLEAEKEELLQMVKSLKANGNVSNYNQIAFLFRSVKSEEAAQISAFLEENGIPVCSPRSNMFFERKEIKQILGCLIMCFTSYMSDLKKNYFNYKISDKLRTYYICCLKAALPLIKEEPALMAYVDGVKQQIQTIKEESDFCLLDIFYRLIAFEPFKGYLQANLNDNASNNRPARNLSEISRMLAKYSFLHDMHNVSADNKLAMPEELFNLYLKYMIEDGIGEYEDELEFAPSGCISFMTIHQSKGLEFPAVVVGSLGNVPKRNSDPLLSSAESRFFHRKPYEPIADIKYFDFWRLYYTAFSRAQNLLVLATKKADSKYFGKCLDNLPDIREFSETSAFADVRAVNYKHVYSFTSHISVYNGCPTQYKYYKEYGFSQNKMFHTSVGSLVHATLEDMNKCIIAGRQDRLNETAIEEWFALNYQSMHEQTGYFLTDEQRENALQQVIRYFHHRKDELGRVWRAEEEIKLVLSNHILQGVVDLIESQGDTVEIVDYKTGPKPDIEGHPERVEHYRKQLEVYAYLIEKRYGKKVRRMHLYYTNCPKGDPLITFEWTQNAIDQTVAEISETIQNIERKNFEGHATNSYACTFCDMRFVCGKTVTEENAYGQMY